MGLTHVLFSIIALASHPQMSGNIKRNPFSFFSGVRGTSMIMVPSMGNAKAKKNTSLADYREQKD